MAASVENLWVALFRLRNYANASHPHHDLIAGTNVTKAAAEGVSAFDDNRGVHPLVLYLHPFLTVPDQGLMIGRRVEIFRRATFALYGPEVRVTRVYR